MSYVEVFGQGCQNCILCVWKNNFRNSFVSKINYCFILSGYLSIKKPDTWPQKTVSLWRLHYRVQKKNIGKTNNIEGFQNNNRSRTLSGLSTGKKFCSVVKLTFNLTRSKLLFFWKFLQPLLHSECKNFWVLLKFFSRVVKSAFSDSSGTFCCIFSLSGKKSVLHPFREFEQKIFISPAEKSRLGFQDCAQRIQRSGGKNCATYIFFKVFITSS